MSEIMANTDVRILLPVEHRLTIDDNSQRWNRETVLTSYRVIDPLGLVTRARFQSSSRIAGGGSCGYTPSLGVLQPVTTWHRDATSLPQTSTCTQSNPAFATEYQTGKMRRTIPAFNTCYIKEATGEFSLVTDVDRNCEFYDEDGQLPLWQNFEDRMSRAAEVADRHPGRVEMQRWDDRQITPDADLFYPTDLRRILGKAILSRVAADGTHRVWVLVLDDFNQFLPEILRLDDTAENIESWMMPPVGMSRVFYVNEDNDLTYFQTPSWVDPVLFETITGEPFPAQCAVKQQEQAGLCRDLQISYYKSLRALEATADIDADSLAAIWAQLPTPLVGPAQP